MGVVPSMATSFAMSCTASMEGVDTDFCRGSLAGNSLKLSASLFATILLKSFCKTRASQKGHKVQCLPTVCASNSEQIHSANCSIFMQQQHHFTLPLQSGEHHWSHVGQAQWRLCALFMSSVPFCNCALRQFVMKRRPNSFIPLTEFGGRRVCYITCR